ncbi:MAG: zinc ribbon domain-containing protein [Bacteroidales bacterium]|nr:zinc ribbon domain-containing protein [Bacteroidales bacterium]
MADNRCPHCGNLVPDGSKFCNHCGGVLTSEILCPNCGSTIPSDSAFCPNCRAAIDAAGAQSAAPQQQPKKKGRSVMPYIVCAAIAAFIGLVVVRNCFFSGNHHDVTAADVEVTDIDAGRYNDIFNSALIKNNMKNDGDKIAYACPVKNEASGAVEQLIGVTYLSDAQHSFYKIFVLTQNGQDWDIKLLNQRYVDGYNLIFDPKSLRAEEIPAVVSLQGKRYMFFAYACIPSNEESGKITTVYFDIDELKEIRQVDFHGAFIRDMDGQQILKCATVPVGTGILDSELIKRARSIGMLHIPTEEELAREKAEQERLAEEKAKEEAEKAAQEAEEQAKFESGEEVKVETEHVDKNTPLFRAEDFSKKINGGGYTVFLLKNGKVYAFSKAANSTFEVQFGGGSASDIGFEDSANGIVNIRTSAGKVQYNLGSKTMKKVE